MLRVSRRQAVAYRLRVNHLAERLPPGSQVRAARFGLQDSSPRDALVALHARVAACEPTAWQDPGLIQTYSPRAAVYVLPVEDFGIFTLGRLPLDAAARRTVEERADRICRSLGGREHRSPRLPGLRAACASGRIALRWTTSALYVREVERPAVDLDHARTELCRRHLHAFGPTTPGAFAWWAGLSPADARQTWRLLAPAPVPVDLDGQRAWVLADDEPALVAAGATSTAGPSGVRLLPAPDLRLFGQDRGRRFVGPGLAGQTPLHDTFHPNGVLADGRIVGAWGRRGGRVHVRVAEPLAPRVRRALEAEVETLPIPGAEPSLSVDIG